MPRLSISQRLALAVFLSFIAASAALCRSATAAGPIVFQDLTDASGILETSYGRTQFNRRTGQMTTTVTVKNIGALDVQCPLVLVFISISDANVTLANADGTTPEGYSYVDLSPGVGSNGILAPGESTQPVNIVFDNASRTRFTFDAKCFAVLASFRAIADCAPTEGLAPLQVRFRTRAESPGSSIVRYRWDFEGDGNFDTSDPVARDYTRTFSQQGTYNAVLEVTNNFGEVATDTCTIEVRGAPPTATADASPSNGAIPLTVNFTGSGSDPDGNIVLYEWDFEGDGVFDFSSPSTASTSHVYTTLGTFTAVLRVTDNDGLTGEARTTTTVIRPAPPGSPSVLATASPTTGNAPLTVNLNGSATDDGTIVLWEWDFDGDGTFDFSSPSSPATTHVYSEAGVFGAALRATDNDGNTGIDNVEIVVGLVATLLVRNDTFDPSAGQAVAIETSINAPSPVRLLLKDENGVVVRTLVNENRGAGSYSDSWDGNDDSGRLQPQGSYFAVLEYEVGGVTQTLDLTDTTGGTRYNPSRSGFPRTFSPFEDDLLRITFTVPNSRGASEIQAFIGLFRVNTRFITLLDREPFGVGTHTIYWDGRDPDGNPAVPPPGDSFLFGIFGFTLPDNVVFLQSAPELSNVSVDPNFFDPATGDFLSPDDPVATMAFDLNKLADVVLTVTNLNTGVVLRTVTRTNLPAGSGHTIEWDGKTDSGLFADKGDYRLTLQAVDSSGSASLKRFALVRVFY